MKRGCGSSSWGFTLVEALVAMAVFALGLAALMPMVVSTVRSTDAAGIRTQAVALAQEKIEQFRAVPYSEIYSDAGALMLAPGSDNPSPTFTRSWQVVPVPAPVPAGDGTDLARIAVTVNWAAPGRGSGSVILTTSRSRL